MIVESITELIGNTPILRIPAAVHGLRNIDLFAKLELFNPFGSLKDRIAWEMIRDDLPGLIKRGAGIIENSSGNTAKALAALAAMHGLSFRLVTALARVPEVKDVLRLLGTDIEEVPGAMNCFDPDDPNDPQYLIQREVTAADGELFFTSQFSNPKNPHAHYSGTAPEILRDMRCLDYFCSGIGTSGSTGGICAYLKERNPELVCVGVTADRSDFIPGIRSADQVVTAGIFRREAYDDLITVRSGEAIDGVLTLIRGCGLLCGPSSGAHYAGTVRFLRRIDPTLRRRASALFIVCDRVESYMSYLRERRPELFKERARPYSIHAITAEEVGEAPEDAERWCASEQALVVDIRSRLAYQRGSLPAAINVPAELLETLLDDADPFVDRTQAVLFVCPVGVHSRKFAGQLRRLGGRGYSLSGGIAAWRAKK